jgi:hypothetical protein
VRATDSKPSIPRHKGEAGEYTFDSLRRLGLDYVQDLARGRWTDYNVHDPGVTILEQVCYALTDILYRADFDVADFLVDEQGQIDWARQGLLPPEKAFPSRPVTNLDYRAAILDAVPDVENIRIDAIQQNDLTPGGLYRIRLRLKEEKAERPGGKDSPAREDAVAYAVWLAFARSRNLCEDLDRIEIFSSSPYPLNAEVDIAETADPGEVTARIYLECAKKLAAGLEFRPFNSAMTAGMQPEEIFRGPFTSSGIVASDRGSPLTAFPSSELFATIKSVKGVEGVRLPAATDPAGPKEGQLMLRWPQTDGEIRVQIRRKGRKIDVKLHDLNMHVEKLAFEARGLTFQKDEIASILPRPSGKVHAIEDYVSVQYHFPPNYGVGPRGVPESAGPLAKARARQLRSYLLLFDQHMVDYLALLANLRQLFSTTGDREQTYFFHPLSAESFPGISEAYDRYSIGALKHLLATYRHGDRTKRLLDYFLALYGENYRDDILKLTRTEATETKGHKEPAPHHEKTKSSPKPGHSEEEVFLDAGIDYLRDIETVTRDRSGAMDYSRKPGDGQNRSGLERKLSYLLGFEAAYRKKGEGLRVMEHILLRPLVQGGAGDRGSRCYSFRVSVLFPEWLRRCQEESFRKYAEDIVDSTCPAHIYADIYWLSQEEMDRFDGLHEEWWKCSRVAQPILMKPIRMAEQTAAGDHVAARRTNSAIGRADEMAHKLLAFLIQLERREVAHDSANRLRREIPRNPASQPKETEGV